MAKQISAEAQAVAASWNRNKAGGVSTERLMQMVADDCGLDDVGEVVDLLIEAGVLKEARNG